MKHYGDVSKIEGSQVEPVDIITFGSPCQDLSVAGKRAGIQDGERSNLFFEAVRIIKEMRDSTSGEYPKYAVWENVPGAFSSNKGHDFHAVLEALCSVCDDTVSIPKPYDAKRTKLVWNKAGEIVGDNYSVAWRTLDAQYWGVPQRRKRIYLVADFTGRRAGEILFKQESLRGDMSQSNEAGQGSTADAMGGADGSVGECIITTTGSMMTISEELAPCIRARDYKDAPCVVYSFDSLSSNSMKSSNPISGCRAVDVAKCIDTTYPDPSKNQGGVAVVQPLVLKERAGCDSGGKGALWGDKAFTLATSQDMSVCVLNDQGGSSINVEGEEVSPTLRANSHQHEPVIAMAAVVETIAFTQNQREEVRDLGDKAGALAAVAGGHQQTYIAQPVIAIQTKQQSLVTTEECSNTLGANDWKEPQVIALQGNGIDRTIPINDKATRHNGGGDTRRNDGAGNGLGVGKENDPSPTVTAADRHAVCYDARGNGDGETLLFEPRSPDGEPRIYDDICPTLNTAQGGQRQPCIAQDTLCFNEGQITSPTNGNNPQWNEPCHTLSATDSRAPTVIFKKPPRKYIIRRLTPTECARLQGFPDTWGNLAPYDPADADFWEDVRKTHAEINGKAHKPVKNLKRWYDKLHTDSAEYKMWGNGIALPNARYVIQGIAEHGAKTLGSLFDGSGGFPLAGLLNGIKPVWASEIEPYPIAVTKSRFGEVHNGRNV